MYWLLSFVGANFLWHWSGVGCRLQLVRVLCHTVARLVSVGAHFSGTPDLVASCAGTKFLSVGRDCCSHLRVVGATLF